MVSAAGLHAWEWIKYFDFTLLWDVAQRRFVAFHWGWGTNHLSHFQESSSPRIILLGLLGAGRWLLRTDGKSLTPRDTPKDWRSQHTAVKAWNLAWNHTLVRNRTTISWLSSLEINHCTKYTIPAQDVSNIIVLKYILQKSAGFILLRIWNPLTIWVSSEERSYRYFMFYWPCSPV